MNVVAPKEVIRDNPAGRVDYCHHTLEREPLVALDV